jgi:hypothetical protein
LGCLRCLVRAVWKQGRYMEAEEWIEVARGRIEDMGKGEFGKYQGDERKQLEEDVLALERWREEHDRQ